MMFSRKKKETPTIHQMWGQVVRDLETNWTRATLEDDSGRHCALGSIARVAGVNGRLSNRTITAHPVAGKMVQQMADEIGTSGCPRWWMTEIGPGQPHRLVYLYNDVEGQDAVVAIARRLAERNAPNTEGGKGEGK